MSQSRLAKLLAFSAGDWVLLGESVATLVTVSTALRLASLPRVQAWATHLEPVTEPPTIDDLRRVIRFAAIGARFTGFKCLTRSLTLARMLARRGADSAVRIGVRTDRGTLKAHAWVEKNGRVLNDSWAHVAEYAAFDPSTGG